jgi:hypothetical protein
MGGLLGARRTALPVQFLVFGVLPNLLLAVCTLGLSVPRPWVNFDLLAFGIVALFLPPALAIAGFATLMVLELATDIAPIFHFDPVSFLASSSQVGDLSFSLQVLPPSLWLGFPLGVAGQAFFLWRTERLERLRVAMALGVVIVLAVSLDVANGTSRLNGGLFHVDGSFAQANFAFSPVVRVASEIPAYLGYRNDAPRWGHVDSALVRGLALIPHTGPAPGNNIALVLVESWGTMNAPGMDDYFLKPLLDPALFARYHVARGVIPYSGSTTSAELRELCNVSGSYRMLRPAHVPDCWPARLTRQGYHVVAIHGFWSTMFDRFAWWPEIGLSHDLFMGDRAWQLPARRCGTSFRGVCDVDAVAELGNQLRKGPDVFAYLLTLNSHLPVAQRLPRASTLDCARAPSHLTDKQCAIAGRWRLVFDAVASLAKRNDIGQTSFVLVGDHAPPFFHQTDSQAFSHSDVPFIILTPRSRS